MGDLGQTPLVPAALTRRELRAREAAALAAADAAAAASIPTSRRERRAAEAASIAASTATAPQPAVVDAASTTAAPAASERAAQLQSIAEQATALHAAVHARPVVTVETTSVSPTLDDDLIADSGTEAIEVIPVAEAVDPAIAPFLADPSVLEVEPVISAAAVPTAVPVDSAAPVWAAVPVVSAPTVARKRRFRSKRAAGRPPVATPGSRRPVAARLVSFGALVGIAGMVVGLSVPASAFFVETPTALLAVDAPTVVAGQVLDVVEASEPAPVQRDTWAMTSEAELRQASTIRRDYSYEVVNEGPVRWPFPVAVPISDGYGARVSPCSGCSSQHKGTDFTPGVGAPITAIADGVVSVKEVSSWGFGNHVFIDHVINGQKVTSVYAHMQEGSSSLQVGDVVTAGEFVGLVGATGAATGPHLHLEIRLDGVVQVDPFAWLKANAS